jgi:hypothetical protein
MQVVSRKAAIADGLKFFFTGDPCRKGHVTDRYVSTGKCTVCRSIIKKKFRDKNKETVRSYGGRYLDNVSIEPIPKRTRTPRESRQSPHNQIEARRLSRQKAIKEGLEYFSTAFPCTRGHFSKWIVSQNRCTECIRIKRTLWKARNSGKVAAYNVSRQNAKTGATPKWLTKEHHEQIATIYLQAQIWTEVTGVAYHVDHVIPLKGKNVCGLHVPWNLRSIKGEENIRKSNKMEEDAWS